MRQMRSEGDQVTAWLWTVITSMWRQVTRHVLTPHLKQTTLNPAWTVCCCRSPPNYCSNSQYANCQVCSKGFDVYLLHPFYFKYVWTWNSWLSHNAFHLGLAAAGCARACVFSCDFKNVSRICNNQECALCVCVVMRKGPSLQRQGWEATSVTLSHSEWRILHHKCWWRQDFVSLSPVMIIVKTAALNFQGLT